MAIGEIAAIAALGRTLLQFVSTIQDLGDNYFRADAAWREFPSRVISLRAAHDDLEEKLQTYGFCQDSLASFLEAVEAARKLLDGEIAELEQRKAFPSTCYSVHGTLFRVSVGTHIKVAEDAYKRILGYLQTQLEIDNALSTISERQPFLPRVRTDKFYVPLHISEKKISSALEGAGPDPAVVLLTGGPGKGKSTLARALARQFILRYTDVNPTFTQVVTLECGPNVNVADKQRELLQKLGSDVAIGEMELLLRGLAIGGALPQQSQGEISAKQTQLREMLERDFSHLSQGEHINVLQPLQLRLRNPKMLIVLDDLWEPSLIHSLVNLPGAGSGAKYLVTSQRGDICDELHVQNRTVVQIEDLRQDDAKKVLASHVQFEDQNIPQHLQGLADKIIAEAEANPLVLATLGAWIGKAGRDKVESWEDVTKCLFGLMEDETLKHFVGPESRYPRSFLETMKISVREALIAEQKQLLALMAICRGPSISKFALQFLYGSAISRKAYKQLDFLTQSNELKSRHLVAENNTGFLSIHALTKLFILEQMQDTVKHVKALLTEASFDVKGKASSSKSSTSVTHALVQLYTDEGHSEETTPQTNHPSNPYALIPHARSFPMDRKRGIKILICKAIMQLLVLETRPSNKWTEEFRMCAHQVFVDFVSNDLLCDDAISKLLKSQAACGPILVFLNSVWEESFTQLQSIGGICHSLLNILQDDSYAKYHVAVAGVISRLYIRPHNSHEEFRCIYDIMLSSLTSISTIFSSLTKCFLIAPDPFLQGQFAYTLACMLLLSPGPHGREKLFTYPGLVDKVVKLLNENDENPANPATYLLQFSALGVLMGFAFIDSLKGSLAGWNGLLEGLTKSLTRGDHPRLQMLAAETISYIADTDEEAISDKLVYHSGLMGKLVKSLSEHKTNYLQMQSARALCNLARYRHGSSTYGHKIAAWPGLPEGLARSLVRTEDTSLRVELGITLGRISAHAILAKDSTMGDKLINYPGLVDKLVQWLDEDSNGHLQWVVAGLLCHLANTDTCRRTFAGWPGLLEGLTRSLTKKDNACLQGTAAQAIANMMNTIDKTTLDKLLSHSELVDNLVKLLVEDHESDRHQHSAKALCMLVRYSLGSQRHVFDKLMGRPGLLEGLAESFVKAQDHVFQEGIAMCLGASIAYAKPNDNTIKRKLFTCRGFVDTLVELLHKDSCFGLQGAVVWVLESLADMDTSREELAGWPHLLEGLAKSLIIVDNPFLQEHAAGTIANIANTTEETTVEKLFSHSGLIDNLVKLLHTNQNCSLQEHLTSALYYLAGYHHGGSTIRHKLAGWPGLVEGLAESLIKAKNTSFQEKLLITLGNVLGHAQYANVSDNTIGEKLFNCPELVDKLVNLLENDSNTGLQRGAAGVLGNLANMDTWKRHLVGWPGLLEWLTKSLIRGGNPLLQELAGRIIANIVKTTEEATFDKVLNHSGLIDNLVKSLHEDQNSNLQERSAMALSYLTASTINHKWARKPGLLEGLAESLVRAQDPLLQEKVAMTLGNVLTHAQDANPNENTTGDILCKCPGLVDKLVELLNEDLNAGPQRVAAWVLGNLANTDTWKGQLAGWPGLLEGLAKSLTRDNNPLLQTYVVQTIARIASTTEERTSDKILNHFGLVDSLVKLLHEDRNSDLQDHSATALFYLAESTLTHKLAGWPGLLEGLGKLLVRAQNSSLQGKVAITLVKILAYEQHANANDRTMGDKLFNCPGLVDKLVKLLEEDSNVDLQCVAAGLLGSLPTSDACKGKLVVWPGLLEGLAKSLIKGDKPGLQAMSAKSIGMIASSDDEITLDKILNHSGLVHKLMKSLFEDQNSALQENSADALFNLTRKRARSNIFDEFLDKSGLHECLAESFIRAQNPSLEEKVAMTLSNIWLHAQHANDKTISAKVHSCTGLLDKLVDLLHEGSNAGLQQVVAAVLMNLVQTETSGMLGGWHGLLAGLAKSLIREDNPLLQEYAAAAIANILRVTEITTSEKVLNQSGLVGKLVKLLYEHQNPALQKRSATALRNLARNCLGNTIFDELKAWPGLLEGLADSLVTIGNPSLQATIAEALAIITVYAGHADSHVDTMGDKTINCPGLVGKLVKLLGEDSNARLQKEAAMVLCNLVNRITSKDTLVGWPGLLEGLISVSLKGVSVSMDGEKFRKYVAATILILADTTEETTLIKFFNLPVLVDKLVKSLREDQSFGPKHSSFMSLVNLVIHRAGKSAHHKLADWGGLIDGLAKSLVEAHWQDPSLQGEMVGTLAHVIEHTNANGNTIADKVFSDLGLVDKILRLVGEDQNPGLQRKALRVLRGLVCLDTRKDELAGWPGLLGELAESLLKAQNPGLQQNAAETLSNLANRVGKETANTILNHPGLADTLVKLLDGDWNSDVQVPVAVAFFNLTLVDEDNVKAKIVSLPRFLEALTASLLKGENAELEKHVASILCNLATKTETANTIVNHPGLVDSLVKSLHKDQNSRLQVAAAKACFNLACVDGSIKAKLGSFPGFVETLTASLLKGQNAELECLVADILGNIAVITEIANTIVNHPGLVDGLVKSLDEDQNSDLQVAAARAFLNLTHVDGDSIKAKLVSFPRFVETLTAALRKGENAELKGYVAGILGNIAVTTETAILEKIAESPGLVDKLATSLAENQNFQLQVDAARALLNLSGDKDNNGYDISSFPRLLDRLTEALLQGENLGLRAKVTEALTHLTATKEKATVDNGVDTWGLLDNFIKALTTD